MRFAYLSELPTLTAAVGAAHCAAFADLLPLWSEAEAVAELATHTGTRQIPTTLLALDGDDWIGCVSLLQNDHDRIRDYSPWLASLVVRDAARGQGVGAALVRRCFEEAASLDVATLYLYCDASLCTYYRGLGWHEVARVSIGAWVATPEVVVMAIDTSPRTVAA